VATAPAPVAASTSGTPVIAGVAAAVVIAGAIMYHRRRQRKSGKARANAGGGDDRQSVAKTAASAPHSVPANPARMSDLPVAAALPAVQRGAIDHALQILDGGRAPTEPSMLPTAHAPVAQPLAARRQSVASAMRNQAAREFWETQELGKQVPWATFKLHFEHALLAGNVLSATQEEMLMSEIDKDRDGVVMSIEFDMFAQKHPLDSVRQWLAGRTSRGAGDALEVANLTGGGDSTVSTVSQRTDLCAVDATAASANV